MHGDDSNCRGMSVVVERSASSHGFDIGPRGTRIATVVPSCDRRDRVPRRRAFRHLLILLCLFGVNASGQEPLGQGGAVAPAGDEEKLGKVFADWQRRRGRIRAVHCQATGNGIVPRGAFDELPGLPEGTERPVPRDDYVHKFAGTWLLDFVGSRFRVEIVSAAFCVPDAVFDPVHELWVFDGRELRQSRLGVTANKGTHYAAAQPDFRYHRLDYPVLTMEMLPVFLARGVMLPGATMQEIQNIASGIAPHDMTIAGNAIFEGRECLLLRTLPSDDETGVFFELWVELGRESAVVRALRFEGALESFVDIHYRQTPHGWLPARWRYTRLGFRRSLPVQIIQVVVKQYEVNPALRPGLFQLKPTAGMVVQDDVERRVYLLGPNGERLPVGGRIASEGYAPAVVTAIAATLLGLLAVGLAAWKFLLVRRVATGNGRGSHSVNGEDGL